MKRGGRPKRDESEQKALIILDAAAATFAQHGYLGTSIDRIAKAANVGRPTIYARHGSKANLLKQVLNHVLERHLMVVNEQVAHQPLEEGLRDLLANIIVASIDPLFLGMFRIYLSEAIKFDEIFDAFRLMMETQTKGRLTSYINRHPERADLIVSADETATVLLEIVSSIVLMASTHPDHRDMISPDAEAARIVRTVLHGLLHRDRRK